MGIAGAECRHYLCGVNFAALTLALSLLSASPDREAADTLASSVSTADIKLSGTLSSSPLAFTELNMQGIERNSVRSAGDLSAVVPNFFQPDYGSHMTSSMYFRGFGSRMDQAVVGIYVDGVPVLNKNAYDFDFPDLRKISVLRGPQSVLFGRNTSLGVICLETLSPFDWTGMRAVAEAVSNGSWKGSASVYRRPSSHFGWSASATFSHEGGFFDNAYDGSRCDSGNALSLRGRLQWRDEGGWRLDNSISAGWLREGGYAYALWDPAGQTLLPVNYNDPSGYERLHITDALSASRSWTDTDLSVSASWQLLDDALELDNDFTPASCFRLLQQQTEHGATAEMILRRHPADSRWTCLAGSFVFGKWLKMHSPVTFLEDGIDELILANANAGIATAFPGERLLIRERSFPIDSEFYIPVYGVSAFSEISWHPGIWTISAGLRLNAEWTSMDYGSGAGIHYLFTLFMDDYKSFVTEFSGRERQSFFVPVPKLSVSCELERACLYAVMQRGYKAGGFNTQLFSDILQNRMMDGLMRNLGVSMHGASYDSASATRYRPESTWNFELGSRFFPAERLHVGANLFWIECTNQQITVMAPGMGTGRMMSNAARSRSRGAELSAAWSGGAWSLNADYGYTLATDSDGRRIPYAPENTLSLSGLYAWKLPDGRLADAIDFAASLRGVGRIWWDEENSLCQPFYAVLRASVTLRRGGRSLSLWGDNLSNAAYNTFWFRSMRRDFFSMGKPIRFGIRLNCNI